MTVGNSLCRPFVPRQAAAEAAISPLLGRAPARLGLDGVELTVTFSASGLDTVRSMARGETLARLEWTLNGVASEVLLPAAIVTDLIAPLEETLDGALDWGTAPMLLELLLAPCLDQAETLLGQTFRLCKLEPNWESEAAGPRVGVMVRGSLAGTPFAAWLHMAPNALDAVMQLARLLPTGPQQVRDPPIAVAARVGLARLTAGALASVQVGDAIVVEDGPLQRDKAVIVVGESRVITARRRAAWSRSKECRRREPSG